MAALIAREQRALGLDAVSVCLPNRYASSPDFELAQRNERSVSFSKFFGTQFLTFDVYHFYYDKTFTGTHFRDINVLKRLGKHVVTTFLGCDIRDPDLPGSREDNAMCVACGRNGCSPNRDLLRTRSRNTDACYVTTPDLLEGMAHASWLPLTVDRRDFAEFPKSVARDFRSGEPLRVFHAPTDPVKKGTGFILRAIANLQDAGIAIDLVAPDHRARSDLIAMARTCHVAIDQLVSGVYGTFSVEMMAAGVPVMAGCKPELWHLVDLEGMLVSGTTTLEADLLDIVERRVDLGVRAQAGFDRFERLHCPEKVALKASESYFSPSSAPA